jgi:hypothetical protein
VDLTSSVMLVIWTAFSLYVFAVFVFAVSLLAESYCDGDFKQLAATTITLALQERSDEFFTLGEYGRQLVLSTISDLEREIPRQDVSSVGLADLAGRLIAETQVRSNEVALEIIRDREPLQDAALARIEGAANEPLALTKLRSRAVRAYSRELWSLRWSAMKVWGPRTAMSIAKVTGTYVTVGTLLGTLLLAIGSPIFIAIAGNASRYQLTFDGWAILSNVGVIAATVSFAVGLFFAVVARPLRVIRATNDVSQRRFVTFALVALPLMLVVGSIQLSTPIYADWIAFSTPTSQSLFESELGTRAGMGVVCAVLLAMTVYAIRRHISWAREGSIPRSTLLIAVGGELYLLPMLVILAAVCGYVVLRPEIAQGDAPDLSISRPVVSVVLWVVVATWTIAFALVAAGIVVRGLERRARFRFFRSIGLKTRYILHPLFAAALCWLPIAVLYPFVAHSDGSWLLDENPRPPNVMLGAAFLLSLVAALIAPFASVVVAAVQLFRRGKQNQRLALAAHLYNKSGGVPPS